ncbi:hypothetical protein IAD21_04138 [Abditibacteriota bacterium]|nr:hypothetical protein IAD21_04138 [Abditibacteriota bacterium]
MEHSSTRPHEIKGARKARPWSINRLLVALIGVYQRHISPRKGWRCAYSVMHGGPGCSGFARESIEIYGWQAARPLVRQRFRDCHSAAQTMRARRAAALFAADGGPAGPGPGPGPGPGRRRGGVAGSDSGDGPDGCDLLSDLPCFGGGDGDHSSSCSLPSFDACHIGSCDIGGCHGFDSCSGCDGCGGCDSCSCDSS